MDLAFASHKKAWYPHPSTSKFSSLVSMRRIMGDHDASMGSIVAVVGMGWVSKSMPATNFEVLAHRVVLLLVQVCFNHHINLVISCPVPIQCVLAESRDVGHIQPHLLLGESGLLGWCAMERWIAVRALRRWQRPCYLSRSHQCRSLDASDLPSYLRCQKGQDLWCSSVIRYPHQVFVHQNGVVVPGFVSWASMANVCHGDVLSAGSGKTV